MLLSELTADMPWKSFDKDVEVRRAIVDSRQVRPGDLFVAIRGLETDGAKFVPQALAAGAVAVAAENRIDSAGAPLVQVPDARRFAALAAHRLAGDPTADLTLIGITGTNAKTTDSYLLETVLQKHGREVGIIGTINYRYQGKTLPAPFTTPEAPDLVAMLVEMKQAGVDTVVMEVSSHALQLQRVVGCLFDVGVFTNFSRDHLDFHGGLDTYFAAKMRLFTEILPQASAKKPDVFAAVNVDDPAGEKILDATPIRAIRYGEEQEIRWLDHTSGFSGLRGRLHYADREVDIATSLLGDFQATNVLACAAVCHGMGVKPAYLAEGIAACRRVPGRLEPVGRQDFLVLVDYAHTPDALDSVLSTLRRLSRGRLLVVFGCGGDRDRGKRPLMGTAVAQRADLTVVTSDNPRSEDPQRIIEMILPGIEPMKLTSLSPHEIGKWNGRPACVVEPERAKAIKLAIDAARPGDVVLIAGKGHENYQIVGKERLHFDDREVAEEALAGRGEG